MASRLATANSPIIVNTSIDSNVARPAFSLPTPSEGLTQSISTWIYIKDYSYNFGNYKYILTIGNQSVNSSGSIVAASGSSSVQSPSLILYPETNSLKVLTSTTSVSGLESCDISNIPLLTWVNIIYVLNNRSVSVFINGKLERTIALQGIPIIPIQNNNCLITPSSDNNLPGYYGKIGKTQYFTKSLALNEIENIYTQGPLGNSQYNFSMFNDGKLVDISNGNSFSS